MDGAVGDKRNPLTGWILVLAVLILSLVALQGPVESEAAETTGLSGVVFMPDRIAPAVGARVSLRRVGADGPGYAVETDAEGRFVVASPESFGDYEVEVELLDADGKQLRLTDRATFVPEMSEPLQFIINESGVKR